MIVSCLSVKKNSCEATKIVLFVATVTICVAFQQKGDYFFQRSIFPRAAELVLGSLHSGKSKAEKGCSITCPFISVKTEHSLDPARLKESMYRVNKNELKKNIYTGAQYK